LNQVEHDGIEGRRNAKSNSGRPNHVDAALLLYWPTFAAADRFLTGGIMIERLFGLAAMRCSDIAPADAMRFAICYAPSAFCALVADMYLI
jgi:hypothetical protein